MENANILISGAGIAGLTLALLLKQYGFNPVVVEQAPQLRTGGYMIDFWGAGFDVAERLNLLESLSREHYPIPEIVFVNDRNKKVGSLSIYKMRKLIGFRHFNMLRGFLAKVLYQHVPGDVEFIWNNSIQTIEVTNKNVQVTFDDGTLRTFDLVIGADGLHSNVRKLMWGDETQFEKFLGYYTASFTIDNFLKNDKAFLSYSTPGKQAAIYSISENKLSAFFVFTQKNKLMYNYRHVGEEQNILKEQFIDQGWECEKLMLKMEEAPDFYFDSVSQIRMNRWWNNRVTLAGDACQCVSLVAGQGAALAMAGAYVLAGELKKSRGNFAEAFQNYQQIMMPEIERKQKMALKFAASFVPKTRWGILVRNTFANFMFLPIVSKWFVKSFLLDSLKLENYAD